MEVLAVRAHGLVGSLFTADRGPRPGVVALGGSEGGCPTHIARLLATEGFSCLALSYFGAAGLPGHLVEVPIDYLETALRWFAERPEVHGDRVGLLGASKGAELALLAAALLPETVSAVAAYAPSSVAFAGIAFRGDGRRRSSWSFRGAPVPFVPYPPRARPSLGARGLSLYPLYRAALDDTEAVAAAAIPIERAEASILLIAGGRDRMWPSSAMADMLEARLTAAGKNDQVVQLRFDDAGHSFMPWAPDGRSELVGRVFNGLRLLGVGGLFDLGGRPKANRDALREAWPEAVAFFQDKLT